MAAVLVSVITMVTGLVVATMLDAPAVAPFGWFLVAIGAAGIVVNLYIARRGGR